MFLQLLPCVFLPVQALKKTSLSLAQRLTSLPTSAITQDAIIYDSYNGSTGGNLIPFTSGACNVWYAFEKAFSYPVGKSVPVNAGYAYMTGDVGACISLCAGWTKSYTTSPSQSVFKHRQLYAYPESHGILNYKDWSRFYTYDYECMVVDQNQSCYPVFTSNGKAYGDVYCVNDVNAYSKTFTAPLKTPIKK